MKRVETSAWHDTVAARMAAGYDQLVTLMAIDDEGISVWLRLRNAGGTDAVLATDADGVSTIIDLIPAAAWYEREAAEMFGITFVGHDTAPLLLPAGTRPPMPEAVLLDARQSTPWPGEKDPGGTTPRRRTLPPGVAGGAR